LVAMAREPWLALRELEWLEEHERAPVRWPFPAAMPADELRTLHERFMRCARERADAIALRAGEHALSYAQLDAASSRLAQQLVEAGARPDSLIGLCAPRSLELVVGLLAILKSGAGYLPLDPEYPPERLAFLVDDARARIVVAP